MKKIYLFLIATCLSLSGLFAQALVAEQGMNSIPDEVNIVGSRNNAPQATYSYHYSFDEDGTLETYYFFKGSGTGITAISLVDIIWLPLPNNTNGEQMQYSMSYKSSVGQTHYGQISCPPPGTYTIVTSSSNMDANSKMWAGGDLSYGTVTSSNSATYGYYYNVVADDIYQGTNCDIETTGYADSWISYDGKSTTNFKSGSFTVELGRHGYPYIYSTSLKDVNNNSLDITINDSRNLTTTYISAEMIPNREEMTVSLSGDDGNGNQMKFVFNVSDFNENGSVPAGTYTVGTDVSGMVYDLDGFTSWQLSRGTFTVAYDSEGRITMSVSSLYGLSDGVEYTLNLSMNGINVSIVACPEVVYFISNGDLYASNFISEGTNTTVYHLGWFKDGDNSKRPGLQMSFCFSKSDIRYVNGKVVPPDGTYPFHPGNHFKAILTNSSGYSTEEEVTTVNNHTVAGYQWILLEDDQFNRISAKSSFLDESNTRYYLNSGYVTISTQSDGVHIVVEANGGTDPDDVMNLPFKFIIQPNSGGYKFDVSEIVGEGSVTKTPEKCLYQEGSQIILAPQPAEGWTFTGWTGDCANLITDNGDGTYTFTVPANDCAVIANFEESIGYTLTWDFNGGVTTSQDNEYTHGKNIPEGEFIFAPQDPTREGYHFDGWLNSVTNVVETAEAGMMPSLMPDEDLTYIAQWTANACAYTVHFDSNGGSGTMTDQEFTCGVADNLNPNEFVGPAATITYNYHGATSGDDEPSATVNKPFGVWEDNVEEELHDDKEEINLSVSNGATVTMTAQWDWYPSITLPTPEKTGYSFNGWYTEETGGTLKGEGGASFTPAGDITLHAQWTANTYTVTFQDTEADGGTVWQNTPFAYGTTPAYNGNETPSKDATAEYSYVFAGWTDGITEYSIGTALPIVTGEATYFAIYTQVPVSYELSWDVNNGNELTGEYTNGQVEYNAQIIAPATPTREGYTFAGWLNSIKSEVENPDAETNVMSTAMPAQPLTYTAQWT
nr:InlB B-repeat-containing protein [Paludibacteraceae bacterium]